MNNPNPFVPKGSLLEQQSARRSRLKLAVFCVLAVSVTGLVAMLIQGCKRSHPDDVTPPPLIDTNPPPPLIDTNPIVAPTNPIVIPPPALPTNPIANPLPPAGGSEYAIVQGDSLAKIAKAHGVTLKALQAANPTAVPTKLKIGQKIVIPAGGKTSADVTAPTTLPVGDASGATYKVVSGDTLTKIAKKNGTTIKALQTANNLTTTKIHVGQTLKIPAKAAGATPAAPAPVVDVPPAPPVPPVTTPAAPR